ncbi:hypothetical protein GCM10009715_41810 [Paeniglutamicibacter psychrophenolicus]|uniref:DUF4913 domain-containing protein n=1 Tax=Paeniglutamicibacter psychrophenolicus TaxID=257454 RepID=A0ABS4WKB2_9MICC|nr:hypothetical protein [Paeniglutamicibacter psychrophenolicus]
MDELDMLAEMSPIEAGERSAGETAPAASLINAQQRLDAAHQALARAEGVVREAAEKNEETLSGWLRAAAAETLAQAERTRDRAAADVEKIAGEVEAAKTNAAQEDNGNKEARPDPGEAPAAQEESPLVYQSAEEFLHEHLLPLYNRIIDSRNGKWCRQWFLHPEAVSRVEALWRAWEYFRLDPATGMSVWWRDHADPHMAVLLSQKGPFHPCNNGRHHTPEPFECDYAPEGWFPKAGDIPPE